jgi:hypothetical protein
MEQVTVTLAKGQEKAFQLVPAKYEKKEVQEDGTVKSYLQYVNQLGQLKKMPYEDYLDLINKTGKDDVLSIRYYNFSSKINNLHPGIDARDMRLSHLGQTFVLNGSKKDQADITWFQENPDAMVDGVSNGGKGLYVVTSSTKIKSKMTLHRKERQKINNLVDGIAEGKDGYKTLRDIMFYLGCDPGKRSTEEMVNVLTVGETVVATGGLSSFVQPILFQENNAEAFNRFMNDGDPYKAMILVISKAKTYRKINYNEDSKGNVGWYFKMVWLGMDNNEIVRTLQEHKKMYESLSQEVAMEENTGKVVKESYVPEAADTKEINEKNSKIEKLNKLVSDNKVELPRGCNIMSMNEEDLDFYINEGLNQSPVVLDKIESESEVQYRGRLMGMVKGLIDKGQIIKSDIVTEGHDLRSLNAEACKTILTGYYDKLNPAK